MESSKTGNDSIYDFIYIDHSRVNNLLTQPSMIPIIIFKYIYPIS